MGETDDGHVAADQNDDNFADGNDWKHTYRDDEDRPVERDKSRCCMSLLVMNWRNASQEISYGHPRILLLL